MARIDDQEIAGFQSGEGLGAVAEGALGSDSYDEINELVRIYDSNRFLGHVNKVEP
ncbi:MAG: hypothetical protein IIC53_05065, partial [Proteobacteria bacterium]|nr:hypothetical protein [Pseudomonadota bacterium]